MLRATKRFSSTPTRGVFTFPLPTVSNCNLIPNSATYVREHRILDLEQGGLIALWQFKVSKVTVSCSLICIVLTYLFTPLSTVLLEELTGFRLVKKYPAFYGTRRFITAVTSARCLSYQSMSG
jgi:hypothetical protein